MLWLYILLGVLLLIALVMLTPVTLRAVYDKDFKCTLSIGFVKIRLAPAKPKKPKKKKQKKKQPQKKPEPEKPKEKEPNLIQKYGLSWLINTVQRVAKLAAEVLKDFFAHVTVKTFMLNIAVAGDNAADTAVKYGKCCAAVYPAVAAVMGVVRCRGYGVDISPNFDEKAKTEINLRLCARVLVFSLVRLVVKHGIKGVKMLAEVRNGE